MSETKTAIEAEKPFVNLHNLLSAINTNYESIMSLAKTYQSFFSNEDDCTLSLEVVLRRIHHTGATNGDSLFDNQLKALDVLINDINNLKILMSTMGTNGDMYSDYKDSSEFIEAAKNG